MPLNDLRVYIVGENPLARAGLSALLATQPDLVIVGQSAADPDLLTALTAFQPDALVWDMGWDAPRALDQLADVGDAAPPALVLISDAANASGALNAGARGVLLQETDAERLSLALRGIAHGLIILAPDLLPVALPPASQDSPVGADALTPRELEVLALVAEGLPNKTIAARLGISEHTVKFHINAVMSKLGAQSRTEAVVRATRYGLIVL